MSKNPLDFSEKLLKKTSKYYNRVNILWTVLLLVSLCFFYEKGVSFVSDFRIEANASTDKSTNVVSRKNADDWYFERFKDSFSRVPTEDEKEAMIKDIENKKFEKEIFKITKDHPIEEMAPFIAKYDRKVAGFIVGIAKKESNWGKRSPSKNGKTCYNYWGYKGSGKLGRSMGYACFASSEEAVDRIGNRIEDLVSQKLDTPSKIVVWKCGRNCAVTGGQAAADKWIRDVGLYYGKIVGG
jgi:hypothetical protein